MEIGIGIHGEPGRERRPLASADAIAETLVLSIVEDAAYERTVRDWDETKGSWVDVEIVSEPFMAGEPVLAFVNGMGGTPSSELYIVYRKVAEICEKKSLRIVRSLVGSYATSLEMQGCSVTLLKMDEETVNLWDAPVRTAALRWGV
jgi:dihydroxyacetone kinase-like protein